ncbi:MAG TPA: phosphoribosyltransferase family protein [Vicinamibacterales bacterium]|nr:phosphoribosyltransferase family protein [Vicinamibacterales bacterium]
MAFKNRADAAHQLAQRLIRHRGGNPVVLGVPRGGVPMARIVADALGGELDVILVRKIGAPYNPEYAVGAVDEAGTITLTDFGREQAPRDYIQAEARRQIDLIRRRRHLYTPARSPVDLSGRLVIVVDDGIATGASMLAAVRAVRRQNPRELIVAVPVAAPDSLIAIRREVDEVVCLLAPVPLLAISGFYEEFSTVPDDDVTAALSGSVAPAPAT